MTDPVDPLERALAVDTNELESAWSRLSSWMLERYGREASVESALFLVGIQTRGRGFTERLNKEQKQDLIMEGTWRVLDAAGLATFDKNAGVWERTTRLPVLDLAEQEKLLRSAIVRYFASRLGDG